MKKRIITSVLALALAFSLCACTDNRQRKAIPIVQAERPHLGNPLLSKAVTAFFYLRADMKRVNRIRLTKP